MRNSERSEQHHLPVCDKHLVLVLAAQMEISDPELYDLERQVALTMIRLKESVEEERGGTGSVVNKSAQAQLLTELEKREAKFLRAYHVDARTRG